MKKIRTVYFILIALCLVALATTFITGYLTDEKNANSGDLTIGKIEVSEVDVYYMNGATKVQYGLVTIGTGGTHQTKKGVYDVNIYDEISPDYVKIFVLIFMLKPMLMLI